MPGTLLVNKIGAATGTEISVETSHSMTFATTQFKITGGTAGQALITDGAGNLTFGAVDALPTQSGQTGKFLTTDGTNSSWATVDALPTQTGQAGEFLQTDGTTATWEAVTPPTATAVSDQANTSTGYFDIPAGTTTQRPGTPATGNFRINTEIGQLEHYIDNTWVGFGASVPIISGISPSTAGETGTSITITGTNFQAGAVVKLIGTNGVSVNAASTTVNSVTEIVFTTPVLLVANEPYDVKVTNTNGGTAILDNVLDAGGSPSWTTAAGSLGSISDAATGTHFTLVATDPDGTAVTFTETTSVLTTAGLALNSTTGAITGDPTNQTAGNPTTYAFDVDASDGVNTTSRSFSIIVANQSFGNAIGGTESFVTISSVTYKLHTFTTNGTFNAGTGGDADILLVGGGGAGGGSHGDNDTGKGGGGAGGLLFKTGHTVTASSGNSIVIGNGGLGLTQGNNAGGMTGNQGSPTSGFGVTANGGGGGGRSDSTGNQQNGATNQGADGGSGGGGGSRSSGDSNYSGGGSTQSDTGGFTGYGGNGGGAANGNYSGGGGGGAGGAGSPYQGGTAPNTNAGPGGLGKDYSGYFGALVGENGWFASGGGGGTYRHDTAEYQAPGHPGGGGMGVFAQEMTQGGANNTTGVHGDANTGGGGGGSSEDANNDPNEGSMSGDGGSGVVIIRYQWYL